MFFYRFMLCFLHSLLGWTAVAQDGEAAPVGVRPQGGQAGTPNSALGATAARSEARGSRHCKSASRRGVFSTFSQSLTYTLPTALGRTALKVFGTLYFHLHFLSASTFLRAAYSSIGKGFQVEMAPVLSIGCPESRYLVVVV